MQKRLLRLSLALGLAIPAIAAVPPPDDAARRLTRDIYQQLIETNTTESSGNCTTAAKAMAARLEAAGFTGDDVQVLVPADAARKGNLVARLRGSCRPEGGKVCEKPLLLLAHLDVVEAKREDWSLDPFVLNEKGGYFYGRGAGDDKAMAAIWIANLIRYKQEHWTPRRDVIVALTADEETGIANGVAWLLANHRPMIDAAFALNEGGGGRLKDGRHVYNAVGASEKVYVSFALTARNKGGHSSVPRKDNAIYELAGALERLEAYAFPVELNDVTRAYFERMSGLEEGAAAADMKAVAGGDAAAASRLSEFPIYNAMLRTTCVATRLEGGHADNALPQLARATVNCRVLPNDSPDDVQAAIVKLVNDPAIEVTWIDKAKPSPPSPLLPAVMNPIDALTTEFWGVPVIPTMSTGASDGLYLRNAGIPTFGVSGIFSEVGDNRAHGRDERVAVASFYDGLQFLYTLVKRMAS